MTDDWDFYFLRVDDKPASMYLDLGIRVAAPILGLPYMAYIRVHMKSPRSDGLSSQDEYETLIAIEDLLKARLVVKETEYIGRCTSNSCRDFYFYISKPDNWTHQANECMSAFPSYEHDAGTREDAAWSTYLSYLHPSDLDLQTIKNRRVCEALERNGDKLVATREIDHWSYFPDAINRDAFVAEAIKFGYKIRILSEPDTSNNKHCIQLFRLDIPAFNTIDDITRPLFELSAKYGGEYDGWESIVMT